MKHKIHGDIDIGLIQTVHKKVDEDVCFLNQYGVIVMDECHRCSAPTFLKVMNNYRICL